MENLRQLLAAIAALTLILSVVSSANPSYFSGFSAFADHDDDESDDYSGTSGEDADDAEDNEDIVATFGENSNVELEIGDEVEDDSANTGSIMAELEVEVEDGDLEDGDYAVSLGCETPEVDHSFDQSLTVEHGKGDFEAEIALVNGAMYEGCEVNIGDGLSVALRPFNALADAEDDEEEERDDHGNSARDRDGDDEDHDEDERGYGREHEREFELEAEDQGVKLKLELTGMELSAGTYDVLFTCDDSETSVTIEDSLEVEDGEGEFKAKIALDDGTYSGCELSVDGTILWSIDSFTVSEDRYKQEIKEKRKEKRKEIVSTTDAREEHKRRIRASPASPGDYQPGLSYTLEANGTALPIVHEEESETTVTNATDTSGNSTDVELEVAHVDTDVAIDMAVWKSNKALILFNILGGTVEVDGQTYTVEIGYALYSINHDVMRLHALVSDDSGDILKLKLRGSAVDVEAEFPTAAGESIDLLFEGGSGHGRSALSSDSKLMLEGTLTSVEPTTVA